MPHNVTGTPVTDNDVDTFSARDEAVARRALLILCAFEFLLIAVTWPLWWRTSMFPVIPATRLMAVPPIGVHRAATTLLLLAVAGVMVTQLLPVTRLKRLALLTGLAAGSGLVLISQQCLQPWHWLFLQWFVITLCVPAAVRRRVLQWSVAVIYVFSGISRLTPDVGSAMTGTIVRVLCQQSGLSEIARSPQAITVISLAFGGAECLTGILLLRRGWKQRGVMISILLHTTLLLALGPWGLQHEWGVMLWNLQFVVLIPYLFGISPDQKPQTQNVGGALPAHSRSPAAMLVVAAIVLCPLSGLFGIADNWVAWQLYSSRPESWVLYVTSDAVQQLPDDVQPFVRNPAPLDIWHPVLLDRWSLNRQQAPLYPEDRYQRELIRRCVSGLRDPDQARIRIREPDRWLWWRHRTRLLNASFHEIPG